MSTENQKISEAVRSGRYFQDARSWFQTVYIGPVSERTFFLLIAVLSVIVFLAAMTALIEFMPLTERPPAIITAPAQIDQKVPKLIKIKQGSEDLNTAIKQFIIKRYVIARESYNFRDFSRNALFVYGNSATNVIEAYQAQSNPKNADSYAAKLGQTGTREITVDSAVVHDDATGGSAIVQFTASINGTEDNAKSRWTAKLDYTYKDITVTTVVGDDGDEHLETSEPQFQVLNYAIESK